MSADGTDDQIRREPLGGTAMRGAVISGVSQGIKVLVGLASIVFVARLISPAEYGIIAMVAPVTAFVLLFQNLGLNQAVVQARTLTPQQTNALFWVNMAASAAVALVLVAISPLVAWFYGDPRPGWVTAATALTILVTGSRQQHIALMNRNMRFRDLGIVDVATAVATFLATLAFAYALRSYWALWIGAFLGAVFNSALAWWLSPWRPSLAVSFAGTRSMLSFGANLTGFNIVNFFARNLDNVLIAKVWGAEAVGLYDRAYKLMMFPISNINYPVSRVILPALSRVQDEPARFRRMFLLSVTALALVAVPGVIAGAIASDAAIAVLLGPQWVDAAPIFFWLCVAAVVQPVNNATGWLFMALGRTREMMVWGVVGSSLTVAAFVAGLPWGPVGVAKAYAAVQILLTPMLFVWCTRKSPLRARDLYSAILPSLFGGAAAALAAAWLPGSLDGIPLLVVTLALCYGFAMVFQLATPNGRRTVRTLLRHTRSLLPRRGGGRAS
jgi:PST family polysaccharide transporter